MVTPGRVPDHTGGTDYDQKKQKNAYGEYAVHGMPEALGRNATGRSYESVRARAVRGSL